MIPRLRAEESLNAANRVALGVGPRSKEQKAGLRSLQRRWEREARPRPRTPATPSGIWGGLATMPGMKVVLVPVKRTDG